MLRPRVCYSPLCAVVPARHCSLCQGIPIPLPDYCTPNLGTLADATMNPTYGPPLAVSSPSLFAGVRHFTSNFFYVENVWAALHTSDMTLPSSRHIRMHAYTC